MLSLWQRACTDDAQQHQHQQLVAAGRRTCGDNAGGCTLCRSAGADECATTLSGGSQCHGGDSKGGGGGATEPESSDFGVRVAEASSCSSGPCNSSSGVVSSSISSSSASSSSNSSNSVSIINSGSQSKSRPMVVVQVQVQGKAQKVSYLTVGRPRCSSASSSTPHHHPRSSYPHLHHISSSSPSSSTHHHRSSYPQHHHFSSSSPSSTSSSLPRLPEAPEVPMVALECELSLSGRLSPPQATQLLSRSMSAPFLTSLVSSSSSAAASGGAASADPNPPHHHHHHHLSSSNNDDGAADPVGHSPGDQDCGGGSGSHDSDHFSLSGSSKHFSAGSLAPAVHSLEDRLGDRASGSHTSEHFSGSLVPAVHSSGDRGGSGSPTGSPEYFSGSLSSSPTHSPHTANGRSGFKRKLPRREDAICVEEDVEEMVLESGPAVDVDYYSSLEQASSSSAVTSSQGCAEEEEGMSERKKRRLHDDREEGEEEDGGLDFSAVEHAEAEEGRAEGVEPSRNRVTVQQKVNCVVYDCLSTVSLSTIPSPQPSSSSEVSLVLEDSPDSVVEVDVVGDEGDEEARLSTHPSCPSSMLADSAELCSSGEASSEDGEEDTFQSSPRPARISPFLNTPKQRKEERRKILKMSIHKMRSVEDPEHFLRRSVLINNTMKRLQRELREEKMRNNPRRSCYGLYRRASSLHYDVLNNSYLLHDEPFAVSENDRITDDMTDSLVTKLEATSSPVAPTPSPSPCPAEELDASETSGLFSSTTESADPPAWSSEVSSTVPELSAHLGSEECISEVSLSSPEEELMSISPPASSEAVSTTSAGDFTTSSSSESSPASPSSSSPSCTLYEGVFNVPGLGGRGDAQSASSSCSSQSQREKQLYADIDTVFSNLIHALGDS